MKAKKLTALLLAAQMLLAGMTSCSESAPQEKETNAPATETEPVNSEADETEAETAPETEAETEIPDNLPEVTFDGKSFRILTSESKKYQFTSDEMTGEGTNDAIYERNLQIQDRFDCVIETVLEAYPYNAVNQYVTAGTDIAEIVEHHAYKAYTPISNGNYLNWNTIPHINQDQPWWIKDSNDAATINGKLFCITGDLSLTAMQYTYAKFFNMDLMEQYGYSADSLYSLVFDGKWTLDKMIEITSSIYADNDGDGTENDGDTFGYAYWLYHGLDPWVTAMGESVTAEENGEIVITLGSEKVYNTLDKLLNFIYATDSAHTYQEETVSRPEFIAGRVGIMPLMFSDCYSYLRDMESAYGVLPYPKYDEEQQNYHTIALDQYSVFGAPVTLPEENYEFMGIIMEALNAESHKTVYPAFYDIALKGKYSADKTTAQMIDLIMAGRKFEFAFQFGEFLTDLPYMFRYCIADNDNTLASQLQRNKKAITKKLKTMYGYYAE